MLFNEQDTPKLPLLVGASTLWATKRSQLTFVCNFVKNQWNLRQFPLLYFKINSTWQYELHPPHLNNVAALPCESQNTENVILQWDITKENCIRCLIASKWTRVVMFVKFTYLGCYTAMCVKQRFVTLTTCEKFANLLWLQPGHHWQCDWPVVWPSEIICACWWWTLWIHDLTECLFIWFTSTFCETLNVI